LETKHKDDLPVTNAAEHKLLYLGFYSLETDSTAETEGVHGLK
jgi:hypothetical protein